MSSKDFPDKFDPSKCILFLGAGFSADATNRLGSKPPVGRQLETELKKLAGLDENDGSDLVDAAGYALTQGADVYALLDGLYTIRTLTPLQKAVLSQPWRRIYTTNYDNSITVHRSEGAINGTADIYDIGDEVPRQLRPGAAIHLHGSIAKCRPNTVDTSLVLSRRSYVEQRVKKSGWWEWFDRDIRISQYMFFLGYDLNDFEPASYLIKYPTLTNTRHFILRDSRSPVALSKLASYGIRHSFEMEGFVQQLTNASVMPVPRHQNELQAFRYINLAKDNKLASRPTSAEIQELLAFGKLRFDGVLSTAPSSEYVVFRKRHIEKCIELMNKSETLVIHGKIGNGKTVFTSQLKVTLSQSGYNCFEVRENITPPPQDIDFLRSMEDVVVFFPSYDSAFASIPLFHDMHESARYVIEMQTSTLQVRLQEVTRLLGTGFARINIDELDSEDTNNLRLLLAEAGLSSLAKSDRIRNKIEFRDFLLIAFDEPEIAARLKAVIEPMFEKREARKVICSSAIFKAVGQQVDTGFIADATGEDPFIVMNELGEKARDLFKYDLDQIEPYSSVVSEHLLKKYISPKDFVEEILNLAREAARRLDESNDYNSERFRRARALLSSIVRFGFMENIIGKGPDKISLVKKVYEGCRHDDLVKKEPLFWLQYCIFWQDQKRWDLAETHMEEAYQRGQARPGFKFYQLDTNYLGLLCDIEYFGPSGVAVSRFDKIMLALEKCKEMIDDGNHRNHVLKAFLKVEPMIKARIKDFGKSQATNLTYSLNLIIQKLEGLSPRERAIYETDPCKESLKHAVSTLTSRSYY